MLIVGLAKLASAALPILREHCRSSGRIVWIRAAKSANERVESKPLHRPPFTQNAAGVCDKSTWSNTPTGSTVGEANIQRVNRGDSSAMIGATH